MADIQNIQLLHRTTENKMSICISKGQSISISLSHSPYFCLSLLFSLSANCTSIRLLIYHQICYINLSANLSVNLSANPSVNLTVPTWKVSAAEITQPTLIRMGSLNVSLKSFPIRLLVFTSSHFAHIRPWKKHKDDWQHALKLI